LGTPYVEHSPGFPRVCCACCPRFRRSKYDDDRFIDEVLQEHHQQQPPNAEYRPGDPEAGYNIKQPEPVAQMGIHIPTRPLSQQRQSMHRPQESTGKSQSQHVRAESGGTNMEGRTEGILK
jgi:hypothetical protein